MPLLHPPRGATVLRDHRLGVAGLPRCSGLLNLRPGRRPARFGISNAGRWQRARHAPLPRLRRQCGGLRLRVQPTAAPGKEVEARAPRLAKLQVLVKRRRRHPAASREPQTVAGGLAEVHHPTVWRVPRPDDERGGATAWTTRSGSACQQASLVGDPRERRTEAHR